MTLRHLTRLLLPLSLCACGSVPSENVEPDPTPVSEPAAAPAPVEAIEIGQIRNVHQIGALHTSGQFTEADVALLKQSGFGRVVSLRTDGEVQWDEPKAVADAGMTFTALPFRSPDALTAEFFGSVREILRDRDTKTLLHCGSANRVGAVWLPHRVLDEGVPVEQALAEAREIGLRSPPLEKAALDYIARERARAAQETGDEKSVKEGINDGFKNPNMDPQSFVSRFEVESREVFTHRMAVLEACGLEAGMSVADIGAGTGLYTFLFADAVGPEGWVYAVDIAAPFVQRLVRRARQQDVRHFSGVVCADDSVGLAPNSIDVAYACDTYHHFEFPVSTLASIHRALKPGGRFLVIDFERIPGVSREFILGHVRAGKPVVRAEIEAAGFEFSREIEVEGLEENYFLEFTKK